MPFRGRNLGKQITQNFKVKSKKNKIKVKFLKVKIKKKFNKKKIRNFVYYYLIKFQHST